MKKCSYCGDEASDDAVRCGECGTEFVTEVVRAPSPPSKAWLSVRRIASFLIGLLMFAIVAPELGHMPRLWALFWIVFPLGPVLCVCFAAGRNRLVEGVGWCLQVVGLVMCLGG